MTNRDEIKAEIKTQLNSYLDLRAEHQELLDELQQMETLIAGPNLDGMPRSPGVSNPTERAALNHLALVKKCEAKLEAIASALERIEDLIEGLEPIERRVARLHYVEGLKWEDVCEKINYSWSQTHRIHGRLLEKLTTAELERRNAQK